MLLFFFLFFCQNNPFKKKWVRILRLNPHPPFPVYKNKSTLSLGNWRYLNRICFGFSKSNICKILGHLKITKNVAMNWIHVKDLQGNPKPWVSLDWTGPDQNRSGVWAHFKEYFWVDREFYFGSGIFFTWVWNIFPGTSGMNLNLN